MATVPTLRIKTKSKMEVLYTTGSAKERPRQHGELIDLAPLVATASMN